jgi:hypothetical protein
MVLAGFAFGAFLRWLVEELGYLWSARRARWLKRISIVATALLIAIPVSLSLVSRYSWMRYARYDEFLNIAFLTAREQFWPIFAIAVG